MKQVNAINIVILFLLISFSCKEAEDKKIIQEEALTVFDYLPKKPVDGKLFGVVELGAAGFNSFIISIDKDLNWQTIKKEYGTSLIVEGMTNTDLVNEKLRDYIENITSFGLTKEDIHFVVSSGAAKEEITQLISKELINIGYTVNKVSAEQEGTYALKSIIPKEYINSSFLVDVGSGNTKISYFNSNNLPITLEVHGAKYYQKGLENEDVFNDVKKAITEVPLKNRSKCFIIGGVPYHLAKSIQKNKERYNERYTILSTDTQDFFKIGKNEKKKVKSGLEIYRAIKEVTKPKNIIFDWDANFTIGFLLEKRKQ